MSHDLIEWIRDHAPRTVALLIRHAHRHPIPQGAVEHEGVPLTLTGRRQAFAFGARLPPSYALRLFHSPVHRCRETAEHILKGFQTIGGSGNIMGAQDFLRINLVDQRTMVRILDELGHHQFGYQWLRGAFDEAVIDDPRKVASTTIHGILAWMEAGSVKRLDVHVTHDLNLLAVQDVIAPVANERFAWPAYLSGILVTQTDGHVTLIHPPLSKTLEI